MSFAVIGTMVAGLAIIVMLASVIPRGDRAVRIGVIGAALAYLAWTAGSVGLLLGMDQLWFWTVVRPLALVFLSIAVVTAPGVQRSAGEWRDVLLDGSITSAGMFGSLWFLIHLQPWLAVDTQLTWTTLWLAFQYLLVVPVAGLLNRTVKGHRTAPTLTFWIAALVLAGDMLAILTGQPTTGIPFWMGGGLMIAISVMLTGAEFYQHSYDDPTRPRQMRWWQLPLLPVVFYAVRPDLIDGVVLGLAGLIFTALCVHVIMHSRRNEGLWDSLDTRSRLYRDVLRDSQDVILMTDPDRRIEYANAAAESVLGTRPEDLIGHRMNEWMLPDEGARTLAELAGFDFSAGRQLRVETRFKGDDGLLRTIEWAISERAETPGFALSGRDFSERNRLQRELLDAARTDALTGLLNRAAFIADVDERLDDGQGAAVAFIDLDEFKQVNDTMGHAAGDMMLNRAGQWLAQSARVDDVVARLGGDEFAILMGTVDPDDVMERAQAIVNAFSGFDPDPAGRPSISVSIGVVIAQAGRGADLLRDADLAMYRAKQRGGACAVRFEPWMSQRVLERSRLLTQLESSIQHGSLVLHMQPVVALPGRSWTGFEALVRWPVGSRLRLPEEFLPLAQESGLIVPMGTYVLTEALTQLASWPDRTMTMAVNVDAQQLASPGFVGTVLTALRDTGIEPERLTLEITEQTAIQDLGRPVSRLEELRTQGVRTAIDDFGTGFSSMQYLARLPVDMVKIDRRFIWGLNTAGEHGEHDVLVRSMLRLAAEMKFDVIAEGVETRAQADQLIQYGCRLAQGHLFARPRPLMELLREAPSGLAAR